MEIIGAVVIAVIAVGAVWLAHVWRDRAEAARADADALRAQRDEALRDADYHERLARDYRAGMEEHAAARLQAETALAAAASQRARDAQMIRHLEAEVARSRAAEEALRQKLGGPT